MNTLGKMLFAIPSWLVVFALCWCVYAPVPAVGNEEAADEQRLAEIVLVKKQSSNTGVVVNSEGKLTLVGRRTEDGLREFTGSGISTLRISGAVSATQQFEELVAGKIQYTEAGLARSLVITNWRRGGVQVDLPQQGYKLPLLHWATVTTETKVEQEEIIMLCESEVTTEVVDECLVLQAIVHLAECLLAEYQNNPPRPNESWDDYSGRIEQSVEESLAATEAMQDLEIAPSVPGAVSKVGLKLGPCAPLLIDLKQAANVLGDMTELSVEGLKLHYPSIKMPESAWRAVVETWSGLRAEKFWDSAAGIDDAVDGRIHDVTYLQEFIDDLREAMKEACD